MRKTTIIFSSIVGAIILLVSGWLLYQRRQQTVVPVQQPMKPPTSKPLPRPEPEPSAAMTFVSPKGVSATLDKWIANKHVRSPLAISGTVPGNWSFEASFPVELLDARGKVIAKTPAHLTGDWMTDQPVTFTATLSFSAPASEKGTLRLHKDNPSGLATNDDEIDIPVQFGTP